MLTVLVVVLIVTMAAFVLRALAGPVTEVFTGRVLSPPVAAWSTRHETRVRQQTEQASSASANGARDIAAEQRATRWADRAFPIDYGRIQPTRLGSILSAAARYLRLVYRMEGIYW